LTDPAGVPVVDERSETAREHGFVDGRGGIGLSAQVSRASPGCGSCVRPTADRRLRTRLLSQDGHTLNFLERRGATDREIGGQNHSIVATKQKGQRSSKPVFVPRSRKIVSIGGWRSDPLCLLGAGLWACSAAADTGGRIVPVSWELGKYGG
jgi:hypothetical protein